MTAGDVAAVLLAIAIAAALNRRRKAARNRSRHRHPAATVDWYSQLDEADLAHRTQGLKARTWLGVRR